MECRYCKNKLGKSFLDLGKAPPSNAYLISLKATKSEKKYPLKLQFCKYCYLVQTKDYNKPEELFTKDYAYFSSTSRYFSNHAKIFAKKIIKRLNLNRNSHVIEIASNDGYLLKNFKSKNIPILGIEPTKSTYQKSIDLEIPTINKFFSAKLSKKLIKDYNKADLIIANNVYAHVPDIKDFTKGIKNLLNTKGTITIEFPHLLNLVKFNQFDTVYHEHYSYLSINFLKKLFDEFDLKIYDIKKINTHGGSLRVYGCHKSFKKKRISSNVKHILNEEVRYGLLSEKKYLTLATRAFKIKKEFRNFLYKVKKEKKTIVAYGAAAKGNTFLNYCKIDSSLIKYVCDAAKSKQNKYMPGNHLKIKSPDYLKKDKFDYVLILPWNIKDEIIKKYSYLKKKGVVFFTAINGIKKL